MVPAVAVLRHVAFDDPAARPLVAAMEDEMARRYGEGDEPSDSASSPASTLDFVGPAATFVVASLGGVDVGCGGLRVLGPGVGELKRMYVAPAHRGRGVARALLRGLVAHARGAGVVRLQLETGTEQPEAVALYLSEGFTPMAAYGHHASDPRQRCFGLDLAGGLV